MNYVFISRKIRKNSKAAFGFVRYCRTSDAEKAIRNLDSHVIKGLKIRVSMAKYDKTGVSFTKPDVREAPMVKNTQAV